MGDKELELRESFAKRHGRSMVTTVAEYVKLPEAIAHKLLPMEYHMVTLDHAKVFARTLFDGLRQEVEALRKTVEERGALKYVGTFKLDTAYEKGDACTYAGSLWVARENTTARPGTGPEWQLAVKRGKDGGR